MASQWGERLVRAGLKGAWLGIDSDDNNVIWFLGHLIEANAKVIVPVDTGALKGSISTVITGDETSTEADIGSDLDYAPYVELGTPRMAPRAYLGPSLDRYGSYFVAGIEAVAVPRAFR